MNNSISDNWGPLWLNRLIAAVLGCVVLVTMVLAFVDPPVIKPRIEKRCSDYCKPVRPDGGQTCYREIPVNGSCG